jgi:hypothetical protein
MACIYPVSCPALFFYDTFSFSLAETIFIYARRGVGVRRLEEHWCPFPDAGGFLSPILLGSTKIEYLPMDLIHYMPRLHYCSFRMTIWRL